MIRAVLFTMRHPKQFVECLAQRNLETKDELFPVLVAQDKASERSTRRINRKVKQIRSTDPITGRLRGDYPRASNRRRKPS